MASNATSPLLRNELGSDLPIAQANIRVTAPDGTPPPDAPDWIWQVDHPYLHGLFAPTSREYEASDLEVEGEIPADLYGAYFVNGPSQRFKPINKYHFYDGDAMLRAIYFRDGKAEFRQRWVRNEAFVVEDIAEKNIWPGLAGPYNHALPGFPIKDNSNTDVIYYNGKLLSLWYMAGNPYHIDPLTLETRGKETFKGKLQHTLSAHSKVDPRTGELFYFTYSDEAPYMRYGVGSATGEMLLDIPIDIPGPRSPHDIGLTEHYAILHDLPFFHDVEALQQHKKRIVRFHPELPARFGIIPRYGKSEDIKWFDAEPCYVLHVVNCWEDGDWVHQIGCRQANPDYPRDKKDRELASMLANRRRLHQLHRWSFNMKTGEVREAMIDELNTEFPTSNPLFLGLKSRYAFNQLIPLPEEGSNSVEGQSQTFNALVRYDVETGSYQRWDYGDGVYGNEAPIAPKAGATPNDPETDAYVVTFVTDTNNWQSHCLVFDAGDISHGPIARIKIPHRISAGFHTTWMPGKEIFERA